MFSKFYFIPYKLRLIILYTKFQKILHLHTYLSQIISLFQKVIFLKVFYSEAMLFSIALYPRNIYIGILYSDSNQRKIYV